ncbi:MAG: hypothetical protein PHT33_15560, partial [bacterium]|nr:hypothetical protein [bacterium]
LRIMSMGLWPAFLDGMMDADAAAEFIDGYEQSYTYRTYAEFRDARKLIKETAAALSQDPERYKKRIKVSFGLLVGSPGGELNTADFSRNHFTPEELKHALHYALRLSDGYVWIYGARWLKLPEAYNEAIRECRKPQSLNFKQRESKNSPLDYHMASTKGNPNRADGTVFDPYKNAGYKEVYDFPKQWRFRLDPGNKGLSESWYSGYNAELWRNIDISEWWEPQLRHTYLGYAWYRFEFDAPAEWTGKKLVLVFGGVDEQAWVWINGMEAGSHAYGPSGWNIPFDIDAGGRIIPGKKNVICVRVHNSAAVGGIWKSVKIFSPVTGTKPAAAGEDPETKGKKIITFGGGGAGGVNIGYYRKDVAHMESKIPVDGVLLGLHPTIDGTFYYFASQFFGNKEFKMDDLKPFIGMLKEAKPSRFTDNFLQLSITPGDFDWFDDKVLEAIIGKAKIASTVTKEGGLKGIFLDTEQYGMSKGVAPFCYEKQQGKGKKSFEDYRQRLEDFGYRLGKAMAETHPGMTLILTYGNSLVARTLGEGDKYPLSASSYNLLPSFIDGLLKVDGLRLFDGCESSYLYKTHDQFRQARRYVKEMGKRYSRYPDLYEKRVNVAFGLWPAGAAELNTQNYLENAFTPEELEHALNFALRNSDGYVWLYMGGMPMFREKYHDLAFPAEYNKAIANAVKPHTTDYKPVIRKGGPHEPNPPFNLIFEAEDMGRTFTPLSGAGEAVVWDAAYGYEDRGQKGKFIEVVGGATTSTGKVRFTFPAAIPDGVYSLKVRVRYPGARQDTTMQWQDYAPGGKVTALQGPGTGWTNIYMGDATKGTYSADGQWIWLELYGPNQPFTQNNYGWKQFTGVGPGEYSVEIYDDNASHYRQVNIDQFELVRKTD